MVYAYYAVSDLARAGGTGNSPPLFASMWFHFGPDSPDGKTNLFYGFPELEWGPPGMVRIAADAATRVIGDPAKRQPGPSEDDLRLTQVRWGGGGSHFIPHRNMMQASIHIRLLCGTTYESICKT